MFGDHKDAAVVAPRRGNAYSKTTERHRSSTTNSYNKCIREIGPKFPDGITDMAIRAIDKHDQNSFEEKVSLGQVYADSFIPGGEKRVTGETFLHIKGTYSYKIFAHCKTIEMWIETKNYD